MTRIENLESYIDETINAGQREAVAEACMKQASFCFQLSWNPSTEITENAAKYQELSCEWAPNEKVAAEACHWRKLPAPDPSAPA